MKLGMNLLLWTTHLTADQFPLLAMIKRTGFDGVEVPIFEGDRAAFGALGRRLADLGLGASAVTVMTAQANPASPEAAVRRAALDRLRWALDNAAAAGADVLCGPLHSALGVFSGHGPTQDEFKWSAETLRAAAQYAKPLGLRLAIEPLNRFECYLVTTAVGAKAYVDLVGHPNLGCMFDTFHAHIEEKDTPAAMKLLGSRIIHIHVSENDRGVPGTGQVNWPGFFKTLKARKGYKGWVTIESFSRALPDLAAATKVWRDLAPSLEAVPRQGLRFLQSGLKIKPKPRK